MRKFVSTLRHVSASLLVLLLVGSLCAPCWALAATSIDVSSVTNVYFVTYDDYLNYVSNGVAFADSVISECDSLDSSIYSARYYARSSIVNASNAYTHIETVRGNGNVTGYDAVALRSASLSTLAAIARSEDCIDELDAMSASNAVLRSEAVAVRSALLADVPTYEIVVYEGQGGGCSCPDYTDLLQSIYLQVRSINSIVVNEIISVQQIASDLHDIWGCLPNLIAGIDEGVTGQSPNWNDFESIGIDGGIAIGKVVSNLWDFVYYANLYPQIQNGIYNDFPMTEGPAFVREMWNYILRPIAQTLSDYNYATDNRMISGFRDFYIGTHYDFPTNTPFLPLNVKLVSDSDSIGGDVSHPLHVEVTQSGAPVSVYNPVWITFTNRVSLSADTLAALTNHSALVRDLLNGVTSAVYTVTILQSSYTEQQEAEREAVNDAADEADAESSDPDADSVDLPSTDISGASGIANALVSVVDSYKSMFTSIPNELPDQIMLHEGWTMHMPGLADTRTVNDFEVQSIIWHPGDDSTLARLLGGMRALFVGLWLIVFVAVIWGAMAFDLFIAGVCIYCTYGLLLGKPETTLKGIRFMFRLLCSLLGRDPPK